MSAHVDLVEVGSVTLTAADHDTGAALADTGIALPDLDIDALAMRVGANVTPLFSEARLTALDRAAPGDTATDANSLTLADLGVRFATDYRVGCSAATAAASRGTLLVANIARPLEVQLWHLSPAAIGAGELAAPLAARLAPAPSEATRGLYLRQSDRAETLEYAADPPPPDAGDAYATAAQYRDRNSGSAAEGGDALIGELLAAAARYTDRRLGVCPGGFAPIPERTVRFWCGRRPSRVLGLRDEEGALWPLRSWTRIAADYAGAGIADRVWTPADAGAWVVLEPVSEPGGRPGRMLRIWGGHRDAAESVWPSDPGVVDVTGMFGWRSTPGPVRELTVAVARHMRDAHRGGSAAMMAAADVAVATDPKTAILWRRAEMEFSAGRVERLGVLSGSAARRRY